MLVPKIKKRFYKLADVYFTRVLLRSIKSIDINNSEFVFIFNHVKGTFAGKLYTLASHELSKHGIASFFLYKNNLLSRHHNRFEINGIEISNAFIVEKKGCIKSLTLSNEQGLFFEWKIDIENEKIEAEGINFFPIILSTLRAIQKRYNVYFDGAANKPTVNDLIRSCDLLLKYFLLLKDFSRKHNKKIRLVGWEVNYIPNGVFKILCDHLTHNRDIEYIDLERGYVSYFGKHHFRDSYITCSNLTKSKAEFAFPVLKEELAEFDPGDIDLRELMKPASKALEKTIYSNVSDDQKRIIKTIENYRSTHKKVFVLFAHLFYDTPIDDTSPAFHGMCDWIEATVAYFNDKEHLLLIKPHPSEIREDEPEKQPDERLASFLSNIELPENVVLLEPRLFTIRDLSPYISCGLIWRSSVAMELTVLGIPCIISGSPVYKALDFSFAKDRDHYFHLIDQSHNIKVTEKQKLDVARYLYLLEKKHTPVDSITYDRTLKKIFWDGKALKTYLNNGDPEIQSIVENMLT